jgi:hypothetical protein
MVLLPLHSRVPSAVQSVFSLQSPREDSAIVPPQGIPAQAACTLHPPSAYLPNWFVISMSYAPGKSGLHMWGGLEF